MRIGNIHFQKPVKIEAYGTPTRYNLNMLAWSISAIMNGLGHFDEEKKTYYSEIYFWMNEIRKTNKDLYEVLKPFVKQLLEAEKVHGEYFRNKYQHLKEKEASKET